MLTRRASIRLIVVGSVACLTPLTLVAALPNSEAPGVAFRMTKQTFMAPHADGFEAHKVDLAYPVFSSGEAKSRKRINRWLRQTAWATVLAADEATLTQVLKKSDRHLIQELGPSAKAGYQSVLRPASALGAIRTFTLTTSKPGALPPQDMAVLVYDLKISQAVTVQSLFQPEAGAELTALFDAAKVKGFPTCSERKFDWHHVSLLGPHQVALEFPHEAAQLKNCGDGFYSLQGQRIKALFKNPNALTPEHRLAQIK